MLPKPSLNTCFGSSVNGDVLVNTPNKNIKPPISSCGQNTRSAKPYTHGDASRKDAPTTSIKQCIGTGNTFIMPNLCLLKIAMINCNHPKMTGKKNDAPPT